MPEYGTVYAIPDNGVKTPGTFPTGHGPAHQRLTRNYPARPITNIFIPTINIGGRGWVQECMGGGERLQGPEGGGERGRRVG